MKTEKQCLDSIIKEIRIAHKSIKKKYQLQEQKCADKTTTAFGYVQDALQSEYFRGRAESYQILLRILKDKREKLN